LNGEKVKFEQIEISVIFECEWNSGQFSGENGEWVSELSAGGILGTGEREAERYVTVIVW
jgi:hypothetical protein